MVITFTKIDLEEQNDCLYDYISIEDDEGYEQILESASYNRPLPQMIPENENKNNAADEYLMDESLDYDFPIAKARKKRYTGEFNKKTPSFKHVAIEPSFLPYGKY